MKRLSFLSLTAVLILSLSPVIAAEFPKAPLNQKAAETQGLERLQVSELNAILQCVVIADHVRTGRIKFVFHDDGSVERGGGAGKPGKWRIDEVKNVYCKSFHRKDGYSENCFAVYRAPDNVHYFDYDNSDGLLVLVWRCGKEQ